MYTLVKDPFGYIFELQRLRPIFVLLLLLSSSFPGKLLFLPFKVTVKSPPFTSIFFFFFLSWSNHLSTTSTNLHHKNHKNQNPPHKNQNPQARTPLTHKHRSLPLAPIHKYQNPFLSTHKHRSPPPTLIHKHIDPFSSTHKLWSSATITDPQATNTSTDLSLCRFVRMVVFVCRCVCVSLCWFVCVDVFVCGCVYVCVYLRKRTIWRGDVREKKKAQNVKLIK